MKDKEYKDKHEYLKVIYKMFKDLIEIQEVLIKSKIVHRDMKPDNFMIQSPTPIKSHLFYTSTFKIIIIDFGLTKSYDSTMTFKGSKAYKSPELYHEYFE